MNDDCIFCKIVDKKLPAGILFENDLVMAFLDIRPVNVGHSLVIPKIHVETIDQLESEEIYNSLFNVGKKVHNMLKNKLPDVTGFNYLIANGVDAGQEVFHVHLHIIPRKPNDGFGYKFGPNFGKILTQDEITKTVKMLLV